MRRAFADAAHYIALLLGDDDNLFRSALEQTERLAGVPAVTSEPVLVEVLAHLSRLGSYARASAVELVDTLRLSPETLIVPQTPELFEDGLALYRRRLDKDYSLTDCMSMTICTRLDIREVLTQDRHFAQEGFTVLLSRTPR